jgi:glycosyltransferase involved in cell wall biosynthesis
LWDVVVQGSVSSKRLVVVIPSKSRPSQATYLARAISSIRAQTAQRQCTIDVLVCLDKDESAPPLPDRLNVRFVEAASRGQAAALSAGAAQASADCLAFLEDDDHCHPEHVAYALHVLANAGFTSTTQLELDEKGVVARINDFPTPSGWVMPLSSWHRVGPFDETYRWHLDNEWLGRLGDSGLRRIHLVEATAPCYRDS